MAWFTHEFIYKIPRIALKPIKVYKILYKLSNTEFCTSSDYYDSGKKYGPAEFYIKSQKGCKIITGGYNTYSLKCKCEWFKNGCRIHPKLHFGNIEMFEHAYRRPIRKIYCTIPFGSIYYVNRAGKYISNKIKICKNQKEL